MLFGGSGGVGPLFQRNDAGAHDFLYAIGFKQCFKCFGACRGIGELQCQRALRDIDYAGAHKLGYTHDIVAFAFARGDLYQGQGARDDLGQGKRLTFITGINLLSCFQAVPQCASPSHTMVIRNRRVLGNTDGERVDIIPSAGKQTA